MAFGRVAKAVASSSRHIAELNRPLMKYGGPRILEAKPKKVALSGPSGFIGNRVRGSLGPLIAETIHTPPAEVQPGLTHLRACLPSRMDSCRGGHGSFGKANRQGSVTKMWRCLTQSPL